MKKRNIELFLTIFVIVSLFFIYSFSSYFFIESLKVIQLSPGTASFENGFSKLFIYSFSSFLVIFFLAVVSLVVYFGKKSSHDLDSLEGLNSSEKNLFDLIRKKQIKEIEFDKAEEKKI